MANNQYVNKVDFGNDTLIDLTSDTVTEDTLVTGYTAHTRSGATITGTLSDATTSTHGLMSANDKSKLDGITSGAAVTDVQINSISILNNGIANVPLATTSTPGVSIASGMGIRVNSIGELYLYPASSNLIKAGTNIYVPIMPSNQHESVFYGLAKAAGDSTQSASSNAVGAYTDNAKIQIQKMLGIYEPPFVLLNDITLEERTSVSLTADDNNTPYNLRNVFMEIKYPANLVSESSGYDRWQFRNNNSDFLNCETGRYTTNSANCFKRLWTERKGNLILAYYSRQANTGSYGGTYFKDHISGSRGAKFDFGNITAIKMNTDDYEPAGTQIKIWGQWAY